MSDERRDAPMVVAAIDCGTNSTRLLVAAAHRIGGPLVPLERLMRITRLGRGVDATGRLDSDAVARTLEVLEEYRSVAERFGASKVRIAATSAVRDADNADTFLGPTAAIFGVAPEILSGEEEGLLSFAGATAGFDADDGPFLVADIGGGSTELVLGQVAPTEGMPPTIHAARSIDVGCVRVTERFLAGDPPLPEELASALSFVDLEVDEVLREFPEMAAARTVVGLAGTVTTVAAVEIGLASYDRAALHHFVLTKDAAEDVFRTLATEALADRIHNPGLERERADVIVGGCCVLVKLFRKLGLESLVVSESDILDGLAASLA